MVTYVNLLTSIGGVYDKGAGYLADMQWHLLSTQGTLGLLQSANWSVGALPSGLPSPTPHIVVWNQHREFHYRFIAVPNPLYLTNPPFDTDIPWHLWNTFPLGDTSTIATITGSTGITSDFNIGSYIWDFEWKEYNIQVAPGEVEIDADLFGQFTQGNFTLDIIGVVVLTIPQQPVDGTAQEKWKWNTRVIVSWDSSEQRFRYSPAPVRSFQVEYDLDEAEIIDLEYRLYQSTVSTLALPFWQYQTRLLADTPAGNNLIYFDPTHTNLKVGDKIYIVDEGQTVNPTILTIEAMLPGGCRIINSTPVTLLTGYLIMPLHSLYIDEPQLTADSVTGRFRVIGEVTDRARVTTRDDSVATLLTHDGLPVFDFKTLSGITEGYSLNFEDLSSSFGKRARSVIWEHPKVLRSISARVDNKKALTNYDYATTFFDYAAGQHKPFFISSQLDDLVLYSDPPSLSSQLIVKGVNYANVFFESPIYKQLEIEFQDGTYLWYTVNTASPQINGTSLLSLTTSLPVDVDTNKIVRISYLLRVRLATDEVSVKFINNRAYFSFSILGTRQ